MNTFSGKPYDLDFGLASSRCQALFCEVRGTAYFAYDFRLVAILQASMKLAYPATIYHEDDRIARVDLSSPIPAPLPSKGKYFVTEVKAAENSSCKAQLLDDQGQIHDVYTLDYIAATILISAVRDGMDVEEVVYDSTGLLERVKINQDFICEGP